MAHFKKTLLCVLTLSLLLAGCGDPVGDKYVGFAKCLKEKGAKFYGSYTCPHCATQKGMFGPQGVKELDYIECNPGGPNAQTALCQTKNIKGVPLWEFADSSRLQGTQELQTLADKTSCVLPAGDPTIKD